jgi:hypothetical protein
MSHPAEDRSRREPVADARWLESRIPAVFVAVLATLVLIAVWKALRHFM